MAELEAPRANTERIREKKKWTIRRICVSTALILLLLFGLAVVSIHLDASFSTTVTLLGSLPVILFLAVLYGAHVRFFPEFDYGNRTREQIRALPVSEEYRRECRRLRKWRVILTALLAAGAMLASFVSVFRDDLAAPGSGILRFLLSVLEFLGMVGVIVSTRWLIEVTSSRRRLELRKYNR